MKELTAYHHANHPGVHLLRRKAEGLRRRSAGPFGDDRYPVRGVRGVRGVRFASLDLVAVFLRLIMRASRLEPSDARTLPRNTMLRHLGVNWMEKCCVRAASSKDGKLSLTLQWFLERRRVWGQLLERIMGHVTYISLVSRRLLSAFASVYKFQRTHFSKPPFLWTSCRSEIKHLVGALPLLEMDVRTITGSPRPSLLHHQFLLGDGCWSAIASAFSQLCTGANTCLQIWTR